LAETPLSSRPLTQKKERGDHKGTNRGRTTKVTKEKKRGELCPFGGEGRKGVPYFPLKGSPPLPTKLNLFLVGEKRKGKNVLIDGGRRGVIRLLNPAYIEQKKKGLMSFT